MRLGTKKHIFRMVIGLVIFVLLTMNNAFGDTQWWDSSRNFRLPITVGAGFERVEKPVDVNIDFTQLLKDIGQTGTFDDNSVRVVEIDNVGTILNSSVPFQFDKDSNYDANTKASGTIVFIMDGITQANQNRYYHIYFNLTGETFSYPIVTPLVTITDNIVDEGYDSYRINATDSTFYFQKEAGGFSSWNDISGNDWINWSTATGTSGVYRGIPNAVYALGIFHPGFTCCTSNIVSQGPIKIRIKSVSNNGEWESIWDMYPRYATMTMTKANNSYGYWMLYEGTPGGTLEPNTDFMIRSNGVKTYLNQSWYSDIASNEWVYFSDPKIGVIGRSLFVTHREDDTLQDMYKPLSVPIGSDLITVFGFGRSESPVAGLLNSVPQQFTIGLINGTDFTQNSNIIRSAYKDLTVTKGITEQYNTNDSNQSEIQLTYNSSHNRQPAWSPDGQSIAFASDRSGDWDIYKMSINGEASALVKLTNYGGFDLEPSWYPNNRILFARGSGQGHEDVYVMDNDGINVIQLTSETDFDEYADWSPDGSKIVYTSVGGIIGGAKQIWLMNSDGSGKYKLNTEYGIQAAWSPDGTKIAFKCYRPGANICAMDADGTNIRQLTFETTNTHDPDWSPDNQHIVYASQKDGDFEIYAMDADGSNKTQLTSNIGMEDNFPRWSPDGQNIVFSSNRSGNEEIWVMKVNIGQNLSGLKINSFSPLDSPNTTIGIEQTFSITLNKNADVTWSIDGNDVWSQTDVLTSTYINSTTEVGTHIVNVVATDGKDIISKEWTWTVGPESVFPTVIDNSPTGSNVSVDMQITATFSEVMNQSSVESSFSISPEVTGTFSWNSNTTTFIPDTNMTYSTTYTVTIGTDAKDIDGDNLQSSYSWSFTTSDEFDTLSPIVTINQGLGQADPTNIGPIDFTVVFSEPVPDFTTGDVTLDGTAGATTATVTGSGTDYNVAVSGMTTSGTVIAIIEAGVAHDIAGNGNTASISVDNIVNFDILNNIYIPPAPIITNVTTGNFWVKYTIQPGIGDNVTDSFNISANGGWKNGTTDNEINITVGPHGTGEIIVYAYNNSGSLSLNPAAQSTQISNNVPIMQTRIGDRNVTIGTELTFTVSSTDADGDPITYNTSAKGSLNSTTGIYSWTPDSIDIGTYIWSFCSNDNYGGTICEVINIIVGDESLLTTNITEPQQDANILYIDNIVKGDITGGNITSAILTVKTQNIVSSYNLTDLIQTNTKFIQRVEYAPNQRNTLELIVTDITGNSSKVTRVVTVGNNILQSIIDVNAGESLTVDAKNETGTEIIFVPNVTRTATFRLTAITNITEINKLNNTIFAIGERNLGRIIDINVDGINISDIAEIQNITIKLYYTNKDLDIDGDGTIDIGELDENKIFFYWYDIASDSWKKLSNGNPQWVVDSGVTKITDNNPGYAWLNVRHLSRFALAAGLLQQSNSGGDDTGSSSSSGGGGGGGGGGSSGENYSNIEFKDRKELGIYKDMSTRYLFTDQRNPIIFVNITGNTSVGDITATVEVLKNMSSLLKTPSPGLVYKNINIWIGTSGFATSKNIKSATISFGVENSWLDKNSMHDNIKMVRWNGNEWVFLETSKMRKDYNYTYFEANTDGFSHFAIIGLKDAYQGREIPKQVVEENKPKIKQTATKIPNPKETSGFEVIIGIITLSMCTFWLKRRK